MAYAVDIFQDALDQLRELTARERAIILDAVEEQLTWEPAKQSKARKLLRPNPLAAWELRVGDFRVFYSVESDVRVIVAAVGRKHGSKLFVAGKEHVL